MIFSEDSRVKIPCILHLVRLIDFTDFPNNPNNSFHVVTELTHKNGDDEFRPDTTLLVNGMPLVSIVTYLVIPDSAPHSIPRLASTHADEWPGRGGVES